MKIIGLLILPALLFFVPVDWLNGQRSICLVKNLIGCECWGCGITHAIISAIQFHFEVAFHYNRLIVVVFPLLVYEWIRRIGKLSVEILIK